MDMNTNRFAFLNPHVDGFKSVGGYEPRIG